MAAGWCKLLATTTSVISGSFQQCTAVILPKTLRGAYYRRSLFLSRCLSKSTTPRKTSFIGAGQGLSVSPRINEVIKIFCRPLSSRALHVPHAAVPHRHVKTPSITFTRSLPTLQQILRGKRKTKRHKQKTSVVKKNRILLGPQRKGVCVKVFIRKPKKPNSANRKCALLRLNNGQTVIAYIPGEKASLQEHGVVLFEGGRVQDCPGVRYKIVRGKYDMN